MPFRLKPLILSAFAFLLLALPAFSQISAVEGFVKDADGKPIQGAVVTFERTDIKGRYTTKSDKKGKYGHYGLPLGTYTISCTVDGKPVGQSANGFRTAMGDPKTYNFDMKESAQEQKALQKAAETGTLTKEQDRSMTKEQKEQFEKTVKAREAQQQARKALNDSFTAGKTALDAKQWDAAIENLNKSAELDPKQGAVWSALAEAYVGKAQATPPEASATYDKAFDAFKKALEITPDDAGLYNNFALALAKDKKLDDAKTNLAKAVQLDPPGAGKYYYNLGALLVNGNQNDAAAEEFKKSIDADPSYADAQYQYGVAMAGKATTDATGKIIAPPGTVEALQKYIELKPDGQYAASAKDMITALGGTIAVNYGTQTPRGKAAPKKK